MSEEYTIQGAKNARASRWSHQRWRKMLGVVLVSSPFVASAIPLAYNGAMSIIRVLSRTDSGHDKGRALSVVAFALLCLFTWGVHILSSEGNDDTA